MAAVPANVRPQRRQRPSALPSLAVLAGRLPTPLPPPSDRQVALRDAADVPLARASLLLAYVTREAARPLPSRLLARRPAGHTLDVRPRLRSPLRRRNQ